MKPPSASTATLHGFESKRAGLMIRSGRRVRRELDPFSIRDLATDGSRVSQGAYVVAKHISRVFGARAMVVERYWEALARAPEQDLLRLRRAGIEIVFAPTIASALQTRWATKRRGRALSANALTDLEHEYGAASLAAAAYFSDVRALVLPTAYCAEDLEHVILHELGHALTMDAAEPLASASGHLLHGLPRHLRDHLALYPQGSSPDAVAERVHEALAEAYVLLTVGRAEELPHDLMSELFCMMSAMDSPHSTSRRSGVDRERKRSVTYLAESEMIEHRHPKCGHGLAPAPMPGEELLESFVGDSLGHAPSEPARRRAASS